MDPLADLALVARLTVRLLSEGHGPADAERVLALAPVEIDKALRSAVRSRGLSAPPPSAGRAALLVAAEPLVASAAGGTPVAATACPPAEVTATAWQGTLDGPLLLATAEHLADCAVCRRAAAAGETGRRPAERRATPARQGCAGLLILLAAAAVIVVSLVVA